MKTNFFKIVLPAFALMLAITASLAFTSAENDDALIQTYIQAPNENSCINTGLIDCLTVQNNNEPFCTTIATGVRVWAKSTQTEPCEIVLYKPVAE